MIRFHLSALNRYLISNIGSLLHTIPPNRGKMGTVEPLRSQTACLISNDYIENLGKTDYKLSSREFGLSPLPSFVGYILPLVLLFFPCLIFNEIVEVIILSAVEQHKYEKNIRNELEFP